MKAKPSGHPLTASGHLSQLTVSQRSPMVRGAPLVKFPSAYEALFLNSFGVAAGSAIITARHNLHSGQYHTYQCSVQQPTLTLCSGQRREFASVLVSACPGSK